MWGERGIKVGDELGQRDYGVERCLLGTRTLQMVRFSEVSELYTETIREVVLHGAGKGE